MMIFQKILLKNLTKLANNFIKNCKCRSVFSKSLRLTSLLAILQNDFQSNVLNIEYHTKFIQVREFLLPEKGEGPPFSSLRVSTVHLHKTMTQQSGTFQNRNSEPFMGTLFDTYLFTYNGARMVFFLCSGQDVGGFQKSYVIFGMPKYYYSLQGQERKRSKTPSEGLSTYIEI